MLDSPIGAVVAVRSADDAVALLARLGLVEVGRGDLPPELYGAAGGYVDTAVADRGRVRVVEVPEAGDPRAGFDHGLAALDLYSRDLGRSLAVARVPAGPRVRIDLGPLVMEQVRLTGPDGLPLVLIDASSRRPSLLDTDDAALHSEAHSMVWVVPSIDEALPFWVAAGLTPVFDLPIESPAVCDLLELPSRDVRVRMAMLADEGLRPMRLELFEFPDDEGDPADPAPRAGRAWPAFEVADLDAALSLPWTATGSRVDVAGRPVVRCVAPGGVVAELWG